MSKIFVKNGELVLVNGGYVVFGEKATPVFNENFIAVQKHAEWVVTFAEKAKGKDFVGKEADSIYSIQLEVQKALSKSDVEYVKSPKKVIGELTDKLQAEALDFCKYHNELSRLKRLTSFCNSLILFKNLKSLVYTWKNKYVNLIKSIQLKRL
jgi:hypothetical protein